MNKICFAFGILLLVQPAQARKYKYYLSAANAEQVLAGVALKGRISQREWLQIIQNQKNATYTVKPGDNLWTISRRLFGDAWLWRKMWQVNQSILNPHDIDSGRVLAYYNDNAMEGSEGRIPLVKLTPDKKGGANDIDNDRFVNPDIKQRHRITHFVLGDEEILGEITGSFSEKYFFGYDSELFVSFEDKTKIKLGETYMIVRPEKDIREMSSASFPTEGNLMRTVGEVKLIVKGTELVRAEISGLYDTMRRGDKIVQMPKAISWNAPVAAPEGFEAKIIYGEDSGRKHFGTGSLIVVDKGTSDGVKPGFLLRVFRDTDPVVKSQSVVEPGYKGELQIVYAGKEASLAFITFASDSLDVGDVVVPYQIFQDPPPRNGHPNDPVEID